MNVFEIEKNTQTNIDNYSWLNKFVNVGFFYALVTIQLFHIDSNLVVLHNKPRAPLVLKVPNQWKVGVGQKI